jgi:hypothetical protein
MYTVYTYKCMVLANPTYTPFFNCCFLASLPISWCTYARELCCLNTQIAARHQTHCDALAREL